MGKICPLQNGYECYTHECEWYILYDGRYQCAIVSIPIELFESRKWLSLLIPAIMDYIQNQQEKEIRQCNTNMEGTGY